MIGFPQTQTQAPLPDSNESFERYSYRTHPVLIQAGMVDADERNELLQRAYAMENGATDAERAAQNHFSPDRFDLKPNVCVFAEHEAETGQGELRQYRVKDLTKIVRDCNERITERGAFPAISDGHTPDDKALPAPGVLGFQGNYRLGMIGRNKPTWAIFADEYHLKDKADVLRDKPRRSVELWTLKKTDEQFFDPVAALGSEAPRLPLPMKFQIENRQEGTVEKYSLDAEHYQGSAGTASAAVSPGMANTFPPSTTYQAEHKEPTMLADEDLRQIVAAISETPQFKWIDRKMQEDEYAGDDVPLSQEEPEVPIVPDVEPAVEPAEVNVDDAERKPYMEDETVASAAPEEPRESEEERKQREEEEYMMAHSQQRNGNGGVVKYQQALQSAQKDRDKLIAANADLNARVVAMEQRNVDLSRYQQLKDLAVQHPHFVDPEEEAEVCLYRLGSQMDNASFEKHLGRLEKYAHKSDTAAVMNASHRIPDGVFEQDGPDKYSQALSDEVRRLSNAYATKDEFVEYDSLVVEARKNLQGS